MQILERDRVLDALESAVMEKIGDLLRAGQVSVELKEALLNMIWLLGQVPEGSRGKAMAQIEPYLKGVRSGCDEFLRVVRAVAGDLEQTHLARPSLPSSPPQRPLAHQPLRRSGY